MCKFSSSLAGNAYTACGEAASALHAMALLQVYQAKAHKELQEGSSDTGVMQELRTVTDLALWATKVISHSLGRAMSTLVVQERHLWLNLADMLEPDKVWFLNAPVCQAGLFGDGVENFAQQISVAQKQTEAIKHILPRRPAAASTQSLAAVPPSMRAPACLHLVGRRLAAKGTPSPSRPLPNQASSVRVNVRVSGRPRGGDLLFGKWCLHYSLPQRRAGWRIFCFLLFLFRCWLLGCTHIFNKKAISYISGLAVCDVLQTPLSPPSPTLFASSHLCVVRGCHQAFSHSLCPALEPGKCCAAHADSTSGRLSASRVESLCSTSLPQPRVRLWLHWSRLHGVWEPGLHSPAHLTGSSASSDSALRFSSTGVPQVQGHLLHLCAKQRCPCLTERDRGPPGKGRD